jgi:hypothetical protein
LIHNRLEFHGVTQARDGSVSVSKNFIRPALTIVVFPPFPILLNPGILGVEKIKLRLFWFPGTINETQGMTYKLP